MTGNRKILSPPHYKYLFGPVPSRRLGYSLGVDLFKEKTCTFNCIYCECGPTSLLMLKRVEFVPFEDAAGELRDYFQVGVDRSGGDPRTGRLDCVTFSGCGEPTLYLKLGDLIRLIREVTATPVAVLTNSSLIHREDVRADLALADIVMPSLDAATQEALHRINRPMSDFHARDMIEGLVRFRGEFRGRMDLEILFCRGFNDSDEEIRALAEAARRIGPDRVQLGTVDRPPADERALPLSRAELERIRGLFAMDNVEIIGAFHREERREDVLRPEDLALSLLGRRAVEENDLVKALGIERADALRLLNRLCEEGKIRREDFEGRTHYRRA